MTRAATTALLLVAAACGDSSDLVQPPTQTLYTTPTGLLTANPPQIFIGAGDISSCGNNGDEATAQILDTIPGTVYLLGDNVYENGTTSEFNNCYHPTWGRHKARSKPSAGNHEYNTSGASGYYQYFGAAAGDPSKGYYSYDLGLWHIIVLNSNISMGAGSAQEVWLQGVLAAHPNQCKLAYFHHPLWSSMGGTGSGGAYYSGVRALHNTMYAGGVDVVLAGHRHFYERHERMKPDGSADPVNGYTSIIVGSGGIGGGSLTNRHPRYVTGNGDTRGVLKMYLYDDSFAWRFIPQAGRTYTDTGSVACM
ncbi:MAG TPA: metallophosphoesterase, partial [Gemmatimonadales bacterium]|nr:metallophosphoesterase [Gemmatimonadales bacterium]